MSPVEIEALGKRGLQSRIDDAREDCEVYREKARNADTQLLKNHYRAAILSRMEIIDRCTKLLKKYEKSA